MALRLALVLAVLGVGGVILAAEGLDRSRSPAGREAVQAGSSGSESRIDQAIAIYLANSSDHFSYQTGVFASYRLNQALGLVAAHRLVASGDRGLKAVRDWLYASVDPANSDRWDKLDRWAMAALLTRWGVSGFKEKVRWDAFAMGLPERGEYRRIVRAPAIDASDEEWIAFLRSHTRDGCSNDKLLWLLTQDAQVLAGLAKDTEQSWSYVLEGEYDEWPDADDQMREVLLLAPPTGGLRSDTLTEWSLSSGVPGVRWGADLALAQRGDKAALHRSLRAIKERFPLTIPETRAVKGLVEFICDPGEFELVIRTTALAPTQALPLLLDLLCDAVPRRGPPGADPHPGPGSNPRERLTAAQAGAVLALADAWSGLTEAQQDKLREDLDQVLRTQPNTWIKSLVIEFMVAHPAA